jgi:hypothetical protein
MFFNLNTDFVGSTNTINICFILLTIYLVIPVSGCLVMCPSALFCPGPINAVKTPLPLIALFTCCWMLFEAVLGNKEFEFVVSEMTLNGNKAFNFWGTWCISTTSSVGAVVGRTHLKHKQFH